MAVQYDDEFNDPSMRSSDESMMGSAFAIFIAMVVIMGAFIWIRPYSYDAPVGNPTPIPATTVRSVPMTAPSVVNPQVPAGTQSGNQTNPANTQATNPSGTTAAPGQPSGAAPTAPAIPAPPPAKQ